MRQLISQYPRGAQRILLTAERLIGENGIDNVSLRQVIAVAKQGNNSVIQHYFGSKKGLVTAVYRMRQRRLDEERSQWLDALKARGSVDVADYLAALLLPIGTVFRPRIQHSYALFALRLLEDGDLADFGRVDLVSPAVDAIRTKMRDLMPQLPFEVFRQRFTVATRCFLSGFTQVHRWPPATDEERMLFWEDRFQLTVAIMMAPYPPCPLPLSGQAYIR